MKYLLGMDDTDSRLGHCTTHLGYLVASGLARMGCSVPAYPRLVRLNPNIPFKTRGNAAVCVEFEAGSDALRDDAFMSAERLLEAEADVANGANPALIMVPKDSDLRFFRELYRRALTGVVNYRSVIRAVSEMGVRRRLLGNGMGMVGAAASLGFSCASDDHTYELIAYRRPENCGTPREVVPRSVEQMEAETFPHTFNSYDHESGRVLIAPTGPDPVLVGVRGDSPRTVLDAFRRVELGEDPLGYLIYATNQCTDAHLTERLPVPFKAFSAGWVQGAVVSAETLQGSHLRVSLRAEGSDVDCMVYEPSGDLRRMARSLRPGDEVRMSGGVRRASSKNPSVLNVEKIEVLRPSRGLRPGAYLPSPRAQRHLTKQLIRHGRERAGLRPLIEGWTDLPSQKLKIPPVYRTSAVKLAINRSQPIVSQ